MAPLPRTPLLLLAALTAGPMPACLHASGSVRPAESEKAAAPTSPPPSREFASLPSRPGEVVPANPDAKGVASAKVPPAKTVGADPGGGSIPPTAPGDLIPAPKVEVPSPDAIGLTAAKAEPDRLPPLGRPSPAALEPPLLAAMRAYAENRPDRALDCLKALDKPNQDFVLAMMPVVLRGSQINLGDPDPAEAAVLADQLQPILAQLEAKAALKVERVTFCKKAGGFGRYDARPDAEPYRPNDLAVLYFEVRHMRSEPATGPRGEGFVTRVAVNLEVRDANGRLVEQPDREDWRRRVPVLRFEHADFTRAPLRDYSRVYQFPVPAQPGVYSVTVEVKDPVHNRSVRSQPAEFRVAGP
jgi:hypothetical protein